MSVQSQQISHYSYISQWFLFLWFPLSVSQILYVDKGRLPKNKEEVQKTSQMSQIVCGDVQHKAVWDKGLIPSLKASCLEFSLLVCAGVSLETCSILGPGFSCSMTWGWQQGKLHSWMVVTTSVPARGWQREGCPLTPSSANLCWQVVVTHRDLTTSVQIPAAPRLSPPALLESACLVFSRRGQADGEQSQCTHQWSQLDLPDRQSAGQDCCWPELGWNLKHPLVFLFWLQLWSGTEMPLVQDAAYLKWTKDYIRVILPILLGWHPQCSLESPLTIQSLFPLVSKTVKSQLSRFFSVHRKKNLFFIIVFFFNWL